MKPYGLMADVHAHNWTFAASVTSEGVNNRLKFLLDDIERCADETAAAGGDSLVVAGDLFHVRGSVAPSVLNPTKAALERIRAKHPAMAIIILAGNHDMEHRHSSEVGNSVQALAGPGVQIINHPTLLPARGMLLLPWDESVNELKAKIEEWVYDIGHDGVSLADYDLILHAPIDGVIPGLPDHGLTHEWLASHGFRRVLSGHYHNHKRFPGNVYSIGALAHHTWNDVGTDAGFLIVGADVEDVTFRASHAPRFYDVRDEDLADETTLALAVADCYVRVRLPKTRSTELEEIRKQLEGMGARAVVFNIVKERVMEREAGAVATVRAGASVEVSVSDYVKSKPEFADAGADIIKACLSVLSEVA
ncbi:metallophosphoesterase [Chromobacterium phragmitis]|uniref:Metallophosphoesterase n=1 Tax=Chromobacterium phragmitis TaxID=2202141 RepID=A0ABV0J0Z7_9NEIS